jgi:two-component system LytT family response regulator
MKALIADDEPLARARLARMLRAIEGVDVVGEATDGLDALNQIRELRPDVVFLDIRMPEIDGLAVAASREPMPAIIFTTAYQEYAVQAFEVGVVDYLLKPIERDRLTKAIDRLRARTPSNAVPDVEQALRRVLLQSASARRICAQQGGQLHVFDARQITRFFATDKYTIFLFEGREYLLEESLAQLEGRLAAHGFQRVHRSELVNLAQVRTLADDANGAVVTLSDGQQARVSRRLYGALKRSLGSH